MISLIVISGQAGSGKSTALHVLEDMGYYCIDNLPVTLLQPWIERLSQAKHINHAAVSIDARNLPDDLVIFPEVIHRLDVDTTVVYLNSRKSTLVKRFSETRRKHPLSDQRRDLHEALEEESRLLEPIANMANLTIDTTTLTLHELRDIITTRVAGSTHEFALLFLSFSYKAGVPIDADIVFDVRCLPNPHWKPELRHLSGLDHAVQEFLLKQEEFCEMQADIKSWLDRWLPRFKASNRSYLTVAVGCTGGQHRSVYMCKTLFDIFHGDFDNVQIRYRELNAREAE